MRTSSTAVFTDRWFLTLLFVPPLRLNITTYRNIAMIKKTIKDKSHIGWAEIHNLIIRYGFNGNIVS